MKKYCFGSLILMGIAFGLGFWFGRLPRGAIHENIPLDPMHEANKQSLKDNPWLLLEGKGPAKVSLTRTEDLSIINGIIVINPSSHSLAATFYPSGTAKMINFSILKKYVREWTFREDGSLESETIYEKDGHHGIKTYFKEDGRKDREERIIIHNA